MGAIQSNFSRIEKKYVLRPEQFENIKNELDEFFLPDAYPKYTICNLYYDTDDYSLARHSIDKPYYKEKLRVRSYGVPAEQDNIFAEIKKKCGGVVYKRRVCAPLQEVFDFLEKGRPLKDNPQIQAELQWFYNQYHPVPKVFIAYDREAFVGKDDPELRLTFDKNIRYRTERIDLSAGDDGKPVLDDERIVMEIKVATAYPLRLTRILSRCEVYPAGFSKYGTCYEKHLLKTKFRPGFATNPNDAYDWSVEKGAAVAI
ncbi:MAG: polyphosphate polymerase domain-containing protein [Eubacterium sp.]|nr:polyphosphate polymerase domain-containing protein [Eubacterium sp.]